MKKSAKSRSLWQRKYINLWLWRSAGRSDRLFFAEHQDRLALEKPSSASLFYPEPEVRAPENMEKKVARRTRGQFAAIPYRCAKDHKDCDGCTAGVRHAGGANDRGAHAGGTHAGSPADPGDAGRREKAAVKRAFCSGHTGKRAGAALFFTVPSGP